MALNFNDIGPAQSEALYHFTGRIRPPSPGVPQEIRDMTPVERLGAILRDELIRGFAPYRADMPCVCWSESPPDHLAHLIEREGFSPWGVVAVRSALLAAGGGAVAYLPTSEQEKLRAAGFGHWAVRTDEARCGCTSRNGASPWTMARWA
ncbi:hypothetical protein [Streptomyces sp. NPDC059918]|uniref:hypothetical protein n=1 Tax=unclassified Streptomyces TaxID=2593676 RepID=UPI003649DEA4